MAVTIQDDMWMAVKTLPAQERMECIDALLSHGFDGYDPDPDENPRWLGIYYACFGRVDMSAQKSASGRAGGSASKRASKASASKVQKSASEAEQESASQAESQSASEAECDEKPKHSDNGDEVRGEEKRRDEVSKGESEGAKASKRLRFVPPTPDQVTSFAAQEGLTLDAQDFCDYYASKGWTVGRGQPMKDWRAAARRWARSDYNKPAKSSPPPTSDPNLSFLDHLETVRVPAVSYTEVAHG